MTTEPKTKLEQALALAEEGFSIFPIREGTKDKPHVRWARGAPGEVATNDPEIIKKWWTQWPEANMGIATGPSRLLVLDVDMKEGKNGEDAIQGLEMFYDSLPETRESRTPTGGHHKFYRAKNPVPSPVNFMNDLIGNGLDIRSEGAMVLAHGSETQHGEYAWINPDVSIADAPDWLLELFPQTPKRRRGTRNPKSRTNPPHSLAPLVTLDTDYAIEQGINFLEKHSPAVEGESGDHHTYVTACRLKDFGLSEAKCFELLRDHWNDDCDPPWSDKDLKEKVQNAYTYGSERPGAASPFAYFSPIEEGGESLNVNETAVVVASLPVTRFLTLEQIQQMPPATWLIEGFLPEKAFGVLYGMPGSLKTFLAIHAALCIANGKSFFNRDVREGAVFYLAGENPAGFRLRIAAWEKYYEHALDRPPFYLQPGGAVLNGDGEAAKLAKDILAISAEPKLIVIDTLQVYLDGNENSPEYMGAFVRACLELRDQTGAAVLVLHHLGKDANKGARGHTSLAGTADAMFEMMKKEPLAELRCRKMKEADDQFQVILESVRVPVDPDGEFQDSLVLIESKRIFNTEVTKILELAAKHDGKGVKELVAAVQSVLNLSGSTARRKIKESIPEGEGKAIGFEGGWLWLEPDARNPQGPKTIRFQVEDLVVPDAVDEWDRTV